MGHKVIIAIGLVIIINNEEESEVEFENFYARIKGVASVNSYFSPWGARSGFYLLQGKEGYENTNKMYFFPSSAIVWATSCDGSASGYFHEGDGLDTPEQFINKINNATADAQAQIDQIYARLGLEKQRVQVIRYSETYE